VKFRTVCTDPRKSHRAGRHAAAVTGDYRRSGSLTRASATGSSLGGRASPCHTNTGSSTAVGTRTSGSPPPLTPPAPPLHRPPCAANWLAVGTTANGRRQPRTRRRRRPRWRAKRYTRGLRLLRSYRYSPMLGHPYGANWPRNVIATPRCDGYVFQDRRRKPPSWYNQGGSSCEIVTRSLREQDRSRVVPKT